MIVRPRDVGLPDDDVDGEPADEPVLLGEPAVVALVADGEPVADAEPPVEDPSLLQPATAAARPAASTSPVAHRTAGKVVIVVTIRSLEGRF